MELINMVPVKQQKGFQWNTNYEFILTFSFSYYMVVFISRLWNVIQQRVPTALHTRKETKLSVQWENWNRNKKQCWLLCHLFVGRKFIFFNCSLFNDTVSNSDYIASDKWMTVINGLKKMWKWLWYTFKILFWNLTGGTEERHRNPQTGCGIIIRPST
jgi:hypothetical protein